MKLSVKPIHPPPHTSENSENNIGHLRVLRPEIHLNVVIPDYQGGMETEPPYLFTLEF